MKIAVVGTSHIGALKYAKAQISEEFPELDITFFGLPAGRFDKSRSRNGVFGPLRRDQDAVALSRKVNGVPRIDLKPFDHVLVIADTLGLNPVLWLAAQHDVADWPTRRGLPLISGPAFLDAIPQAIAERADHLRQQFRDLPIHVATAPYPTTGVVPEGKLHRFIFASISENPEAARIEKLYYDALYPALEARKMVYVAQPTETITQPFLSHKHYGEGALDFRAEGNSLDDHRHLNAEFGASLFRAFALAIGQTPQI